VSASGQPKKPKLVKRSRSSIVQRTMEDMRASFAKSSVVSTTAVVAAANNQSSSTASTADTNVRAEQKPLVVGEDGIIDLTNGADGGGGTVIKTEVDDDDEKTQTNSEDRKSSKKKRKKSTAESSDAPTRKSVNEWSGLVEMARRTQLHSVTTVDPGTRNFALMRVEFFPTIRITHVRVLDLDVLARDYENGSATKLERGGGFTIDAQLFALQRYIGTETRAQNGCFNSSMVLVEEQHFSRDMARIDACIAATVNSITPPFYINSYNIIPRCQIVNPRSVKACYRLFFPPLESGGGSNGAFGMGDVGGGAKEKREHAYNKANAKRWGRLILAQSRIEEVVPAANMTDRDQIRVLRAKSDDLYDTLFMALYFGSCYLFNYNKIIEQNSTERLSALAAPPQRPHNCYQEVFEMCAAIGTPVADVQKILDKVLEKTGSKITVQPLAAQKK
jgi:hypothetical protein